MKPLIITLLFIPLAMTAQTNAQQQIRRVYEQMYRAMIDKDTAVLSRLHDDTFQLIHMTGMRQTKQQYIEAIADGTLNYYDVKTVEIDIDVEGDTATMTGKSHVTAAVFGGGRHTWPLLLRFRLMRRPEGWRIIESRASTF